MTWFLVLLAFHILIQAALPAIGDEAYFIAWGKIFSLGFYDHPALPGWISFLVWELNTRLGIDALIFLHRSVLLLLQVGNLWCLYVYLRLSHDSHRSLAIIFLLVSLPTHIIIFSIFANDTVLAIMLFQFFLCIGFAWHYRKETVRSFCYAAIAGVFLGLALLSKYTAIVYYAALCVSLLVTREKRHFLFSKTLVASVVGFLLLGVNLYWNYYHCQINLVFNFLLRESGLAGKGLLEYLLSMLFLLGPLWFLVYQNKKHLLANREGLFSHFFIAACVIFFIASILRGSFGLHWGAEIIFIGVLAIAEMLHNPNAARRLVNWNLGFSAMIILPMVAVLALIQTAGPAAIDRFLSASDIYRVRQVLDISDGSLANHIKENYPEDIIVSTSSYGLTSMLDIAGITNTRFMFSASIFGRNHDILHDYREMEGRDILFIAKSAEEYPAGLEDYFAHLDRLTLTGTRGAYNAYRGRGFKYQVYRESMLVPLADKLYNRMPQWQGACYFDKYR